MDLSDIKIGKELGKNWQPVGKINAAARKFVIWVAAPAAFSVVSSAIGFFEFKIPGSPILFVFRGLGRILLALLCLILGLIRLILTGNPELLKGIGDCFRGEYSTVYSPLVLGVFGMIFIVRVLNRTGIKETYSKQLLIISAIVIVALSSLTAEWAFGSWFSDFVALLQELWETS